MQSTTSNELSAQQIPLQTASHQPLQALIQPTLPVLQYPHSVLQPPQTGLQPSQAVPQSQPVQVVAHPGDGSTPIPTFVQYTMPPNIFTSPVMNSTNQPLVQSAVPTSLSVLNALNDDKLGIILPVLVRMEHKIDQLMAMMGANNQATGNNLSAAVSSGVQNTVSGQVNNASSTSQSNAAKTQTSSSSTGANIQANARATVARLFDTQVEGEEESEQTATDKGVNESVAIRGMTSRQRIQLEMAKITEKTLPEDLNFPLSRDDLIALQAKSTSTMNFAVRLLREMFTREELLGRNLSGVRGKERVDPARVEIIKEIVFKIYRTSPSDRELLWRYCRKAMDSFLRKMQRPVEVVKDQYDSPSFLATDKTLSGSSNVTPEPEENEETSP